MNKLFIVAYLTGSDRLMQFRVRDETWIRALLQVLILRGNIADDAVDTFESTWAEDCAGLRQVAAESGWDFSVLEIGDCDG